MAVLTHLNIPGLNVIGRAACLYGDDSRQPFPRTAIVQSRHQRMNPGGRIRRGALRRRRVAMSTRFGAAAVLAAAWSVPHRCCQAVRVACSTAPGGVRQQRRLSTTRLAAGFISSAGRGRSVGAATRITSSSSSITSRKWAGYWQGGRAVTGTVRMVSDDAPFFTDPDAPEVLNGLEQPGPLAAGGDQVR